MTIGEKIRFIRLNKKMSQREVAEKCEIADSAIRKYELGIVEPKSKMIEKIAAALGTTPSQLMGWDWETKLSDDEVHLIADYNKLTDEGKAVARERVRELTEIPRYFNPNHGVEISTSPQPSPEAPQEPNNPHKDKDPEKD